MPRSHGDYAESPTVAGSANPASDARQSDTADDVLDAAAHVLAALPRDERLELLDRQPDQRRRDLERLVAHLLVTRARATGGHP